MSSDDIIYYNLDIIDGKTIDDDLDPPAKYSEVRDQPIITNISDYLFSITRFCMNGTG